MQEPTNAYLGLGSNLGDRLLRLQGGLDGLAETAGIDVTAVSSVYESAAHTITAAVQPPYLNAVVKARTTLSAADLLSACLEIERAAGRDRLESGPWGPRTLDIDILLYGQDEIEEEGLSVPHPRMAERAFVLHPLADLAPNLYLPHWEASVNALLSACPDEGPTLRQEARLVLPDSKPPQAELWPTERQAVTARIDHLPKSLEYIVIEGVIGVGKTSLARLLAKRFDAREVYEEFDENPFLERFYADRPRWAFQTQLAFLASRFRQQQALGGPDLFHSTVVTDYMFEKDRLFARLNLSGDELQLYDTMFGIMQGSVPKPDLIIYLQASTDRLMRLIEARGRSYERDMDRDYIDTLNQAYEQFFFRYNKTPLLIVNTEQIDFVHQPQDLDEIVEQLTNVRYAGTTYFNPVRA